MSTEHQPSSPEYEPQNTRPVFDFQRMSVEEVVMLGDAVCPASDLDSDCDSFVPLVALYEDALGSLPSLDFPKACEVYAALAAGSLDNRGFVANALEQFVYVAQDESEHDLRATLEMWVRLLDDWEGGGMIHEAALVAMDGAVVSGRLRPEIAQWLSERMFERG